MISIRNETKTDHESVRGLIADSFGATEYGHHGEADIVDAIRRNCDEIVSLVAADADEIVGHILFSPVQIKTVDKIIVGMGLAPMAVKLGRQRIGIGTALVNEGLTRLIERKCPFVVVLGHPEYYPRFGFDDAAQHGLSHGFAGIPQQLFYVKFLRDLTNPWKQGQTALYRSEFGPQTQTPSP